MHFRTKIIITYSILILLLAITLGIAYQRYTVNQYEKAEYENLQMMARKISQQFDGTVKTMEFIPEYLLSDVLVLDAMRTLIVIQPENKLTNTYRTDAQAIIRSKLNSYYIVKNFYRVISFNSAGSAIASNNYADKVIKTGVNLESLTWLGQATEKKGSPVLIGCHQDDWGTKHPKEIFSLVKEIQGMPASYIEVQKEASELAGIFSVGKEDVHVIAIKEDGEILYSSKVLDESATDAYVSMAMDREKTTYKEVDGQKSEMIAKVYSDYTKVTVLLSKDRNSMQGMLLSLTFVSIFIAICIIVVSFIYIVIVSGMLTKPLRQLREQMERTDLENLKEEIVFDRSYDEMEALNKSYLKVLNRLSDAMLKEKEMSILQLRAQFDALQAQVNPHFLYNVLNVLSSRGVVNGDEEICDICCGLATMLRYSTSTKKREATIAEELHYLEEYFSLLKLRHKHKLSYTVEVPSKIKDQVLPKIVLQQIVENSINHGYEDTPLPMEIEITGWADGTHWFIKIHDNGQGFEEEILLSLKTNMESIQQRLMKEHRQIELEIGGMGLVNTYARLLLMYGEDLFFSISNCAHGADVIIGAAMDVTREA